MSAMLFPQNIQQGDTKYTLKEVKANKGLYIPRKRGGKSKTLRLTLDEARKLKTN